MNTAASADQLARSRAYCRDLTRSEARNFYYGLKLLPEPKRSAMYALYAYMRLVDDIADAEDDRSREQRLTDLAAWENQTNAVLAGDGEALRRHILWPAFADLVTRYKIPRHILGEMIDGQRQDLDAVNIGTFDDLRRYCYRVASVVGLASIWVFGFEGDEETQAMAIDRGIAFQLTNVLRDLKEDAARGRCYIPRDELDRFGLAQEDLKASRAGPNFDALMVFQIDRADEFYTSSSELEARVDADSRPTLRAMTDIYYGILERIRRQPRRVLSQRVSLPVWSKLAIGWRAMRGHG